jgi:4-hydroxy-tetrahydrodipicolinate reductase
MSIQLAIAGAAGRMGRALIAAAGSEADLEIVGGSERSGSPSLGADLGVLAGGEGLGVACVDSTLAAAQTAQVWIDFTTPAASLAALTALRSTKVRAIVLGTTGFEPAQDAQIMQAAQHFSIVRSGNFSLGINLLMGLVKQAAERLGPDWDIEISEAHHRLKVDAPSGTALMLGQAAADGRGVSHSAVAAFDRHGVTAARKSGEIGYAVARGGGIIGEHEVMFASDDEVIRFSHSALNRTIFAKGALAAARWAAGHGPGLYTMSDVVGL